MTMKEHFTLERCSEMEPRNPMQFSVILEHPFFFVVGGFLPHFMEFPPKTWAREDNWNTMKLRVFLVTKYLTSSFSSCERAVFISFHLCFCQLSWIPCNTKCLLETVPCLLKADFQSKQHFSTMKTVSHSLPNYVNAFYHFYVRWGLII